METTRQYDLYTIRLRDLLARRKMTPAELAARLSVNPSSVRRWLCGARRPDLDQLRPLAAALDCALADVVP